MAEHILKTWPNHFDAIVEGRKRFEWRFDDRGFEVGDVLVLRKYDPTPDLGSARGFVMQTRPGEQMGRYVQVSAKVTYILRGNFGVPENYVVMSIELLGGVELG